MEQTCIKRFRVLDKIDGDELGQIVYDPRRGILSLGLLDQFDHPDEAWDHAELLRRHLADLVPAGVSMRSILVGKNNGHPVRTHQPSCVWTSLQQVAATCRELFRADMEWGYDRLEALLRANFMELEPRRLFDGQGHAQV